MSTVGKIRVQWTEGRSKDSTSVVKKNDVKVGSIHVGSTVKIVWGKSAKTYEATILEDLSNSSPAISPQRQRRRHRSDEFLIEVVSLPSPHVLTPLAPGPELQDFVSQQSARLLKRMDDIERLFEGKTSQITLSETNSSVPSSVMTQFVMAVKTSLASIVATPPARYLCQHTGGLCD